MDGVFIGNDVAIVGHTGASTVGHGGGSRHSGTDKPDEFGQSRDTMIF